MTAGPAEGATASVLGVTADRPVVIYDDNLSKDAARIWWILRFHGMKEVRLLNGGWKGWETGGLPISTEAAEPRPSGFRPARQPDVFSGKDALVRLRRRSSSRG